MENRRQGSQCYHVGGPVKSNQAGSEQVRKAWAGGAELQGRSAQPLLPVAEQCRPAWSSQGPSRRILPLPGKHGGAGLAGEEGPILELRTQDTGTLPVHLSRSAISVQPLRHADRSSRQVEGHELDPSTPSPASPTASCPSSPAAAHIVGHVQKFQVIEDEHPQCFHAVLCVRLDQ